MCMHALRVDCYCIRLPLAVGASVTYVNTTVWTAHSARTEFRRGSGGGTVTASENLFKSTLSQIMSLETDDSNNSDIPVLWAPRPPTRSGRRLRCNGYGDEGANFGYSQTDGVHEGSGRVCVRMPTYLVQEGCNGRNGCNGPQPGDMKVAKAILISVGTPQLNRPGISMVAEAILDLNFQRKCLTHLVLVLVLLC